MAITTVADLMTSRVIAAFDNAEFKELAVILRNNGISAVPVVDAEHRVVGVISAADLLLKVAEPDPEEGQLLERYESRIERLKSDAHLARDLMTAPPVTVTAEESAREAAERMRRHHVKRLPVVDEHHRLIGILSRSDLLGVYLVSDRQLQETVEHELVRGEFGFTEVEVAVHGGVATLDGRVSHRSDIPRLTHAIRRLEGIIRVRCALTYDEDDLAPLSQPP
ncbi:CBS domain-containing protein [Salinactinospora qingdaonensis]|uniref:CBS domain-containing protein n=1 Tax=Salinactinospora qingdaonensis TaxID=702744 RepID=A0ABP7GI17_9ACTN